MARRAERSSRAHAEDSTQVILEQLFQVDDRPRRLA
jgi:hypothetical protein